MEGAVMKSPLSEIALKVLEARYFRRDESGQVVETADEMFHRVARSVATAEEQFADSSAVVRYTEAFYELLSQLEFLPNSPTLMNAGTVLGQLSACFVVPVGDSIEEIFGAAGNRKVSGY
jgi:ribonucleoside-diphosphate reductase alpha chain